MQKWTPLAWTMSLFLLAGLAMGEPLRFAVTLHPPDDSDRAVQHAGHILMRLELTVDAQISHRQLAALGDRPVANLHANGEQRPAQVHVMPEGLVVHWIEPAAPRDQPLALRLSLAAGAAPDAADDAVEAPGFRFTDLGADRELRLGDRPIYRHVRGYDPDRHQETYKPFVHIHAFHGEGVITKGPGGRFTHHRGLFFGYNRTTVGGRTLDFWHCPNVSQRHRADLPEAEMAGPVLARQTSITDWIDPAGQSVVQDTRTLTTHRPHDGLLLLDVAVKLNSDQAVTFGGDAHHAGLHVRAHQQVERTLARYTHPPAAEAQRNDIWHRSPWIAARFAVDNQTYFVAICNHPDNPGPAQVSARDYGRFGYFAPTSIEAGGSVTFLHRVVVIDADQIEDAQLPQRLDALRAAWLWQPRITLQRLETD